MDNNKLTRKELYDLIWAESLISLSRRLNIRYSDLRKICKDMNVPLPLNGHWSKLKFGKPVKVSELPEDYIGSDEINLDKFKLSSENDSSSNRMGKNIRGNEEAQGLHFIVPQKLTNPDPLIVSTKNYHIAIEQYDYRSNKPRPERIDVLSIDVSDDTAKRAYRIMDTVIKILRVRDYDIKFKYSDKTIAIVFGEEIEIRLKERYRVLPKKTEWESREFEPTGKLSFIVGGYPQKVVNDGVKLLELKISSIIANIEEVAERLRTWRIKAEQRMELEEEQRRISEELKKQKDEESLKFKNLFLNATRLHQASIIRNYIQTVETTAVGNQQLTSELKEWIAWAKKKADWYDPLINGEDPILDDNYKNGIFKELLKEWQ